MAEINNAQLTDFCNQDLRSIGDKLQYLVDKLPLAVNVYNVRGLGTIIDQAGAGNFITDGSEVDGRTRVVGGDVYNFITLFNDFITFMTAARKEVIAKWQVNGLR